MHRFFLRLGLLILINCPCLLAAENFPDDKLIDNLFRAPKYGLGERPSEISVNKADVAKDKNAEEKDFSPENRVKLAPDEKALTAEGGGIAVSESQPAQFAFKQPGDWLLVNGQVPYNPALFSLDGKEGDYFAKLNRFSFEAEEDLYQQIKEEVNDSLGGDIYAKMVWSFNELKQMDRLINSTMADYGLGNGQITVIRFRNNIELDDHLSSFLLFRNESKARGAINEVGASHSWMEETAVRELPISESKGGRYSQKGSFLGLLKYLTFYNLAYLFLVILFISLIVNVCRSFMR